MRTVLSLTACLALTLLAHPAAAPTTWPTKAWPTATPESVGLDAGALAAFDADIKAGKYGYVDSMLVIRHGKAVFDRTYSHDYDRIYGEHARKPGPLNPGDVTGPYNYFNPWWHPYYRRGDLHSMQSVTKTVTSVTIGVATARGEFPDLERPVLSFFDEGAVANVDDRKRKMTLRHLLTMTAGFDWNEDLPYADPGNTAMTMEASVDWVKYTIDRPMAADPGTTFRYNSGATQLLSYIFRKATGQDIEEYADRHLFAPLGITRYFWKRSPSGLVDTEGGLFLRPHDVAKIAYLFLQNGEWEGKAIVTPAWVKASIAPAIPVANGTQYGYKWWLYPYGKEGKYVYAGSGFGGQRPMVVPELNLVIVYTGWNILPDGPSLGVRPAIDRIVDAVTRP